MKTFHKGYTTEVYKIRDPVSGEVMVAKLSTEADSQVDTEAQILKEVQTPGMIWLLADCHMGDTRLLLLPYAQSGDLLEHIFKVKRISEQDAKMTTYVLAQALHQLHAHGIIHGDVKPENILIMGDKYRGDNVILADLGLAKRCGDRELCYVFTGTVDYSPPEIIRGQGYTKKADTWSLGITLYTALTGVSPFVAHDECGIKREICQGLPNLDCEQWRGVSRTGRDLLRKMLSPNANTRMSMEEVIGHPWFDDVRGFFDDLPDSDDM